MKKIMLNLFMIVLIVGIFGGVLSQVNAAHRVRAGFAFGRAVVSKVVHIRPLKVFKLVRRGC